MYNKLEMAVEIVLNPDPSIISQAVDSEVRTVAETLVQTEEGLAIGELVRPEVPARGRIEEQGLEWAGMRMEKMFGRRGVKPVRVVRKKFQDILDLPNLAENDQSSLPVKLSPDGRIYVCRWGEPAVREEGGVRMLEGAKDFYQILRPREHTIDLSGLLPPRRVVEAVPMGHDTIEGAIRQAKRITGERAEEEAVQIIQAMGSVNSIVGKTLRGELTRESIADLAEQTVAVLEQSGLTRARNTTKRAIREALTDAAKLYGSKIPRPNPLITRIYARSAFLNAVSRETESVLVGDKFGSILGLLLMARDYDRAIIGGAMKDLDTFAGFTRRGPAVFMQEKPRVHRGEIEGMQQVLWATARSLADANVAPYKVEATKARINLIGCPEEDRDLYREIIGDEAEAEAWFKLTPVTELLADNCFQWARERIKYLSYFPLERVLADNQDIGQDLDVGPEETF